MKRYKKSVFVDAIEFTNEPDNAQAIKDFTGLLIQVEYNSDGAQLRVIRDAYSVIIARKGEFIVKDATGQLQLMTKAALESEYELVEAAE
ncbi:hypothetical protein SAMN04487969_11963 [Paenibacillus algorifonticola]|uniref:Uncharacterized protein n=1 Tax=Paenibacillus algorifonticola TaxID=684063 RepID=A0A1I2H0R9_9BACL|nr:hypothetical protein [Paenibacillus algorifonticola]SFF23000.1 hypothetical protein SAMN04487969_11963 [Paenibacillus algorifonticola]